MKHAIRMGPKKGSLKSAQAPSVALRQEATALMDPMSATGLDPDHSVESKSDS